MCEKAASLQRKALKDLQKIWKTTAQNYFKKLQEILTPWKQDIKTWLWHRTVKMHH